MGNVRRRLDALARRAGGEGWQPWPDCEPELLARIDALRLELEPSAGSFDDLTVLPAAMAELRAELSGDLSKYEFRWTGGIPQYRRRFDEKR